MESVRVGIVHRLVAGVIDGVIVSVLVFVPNVVLGRISPMLAGMVSGLLALAYFSFEVLKAQSVGKMFLKLKITKQDGSPASQDQLVKRYAFKFASYALMIVAAVPFLHVVSFVALLAGLAVLVSSLFMLKPEKLAYHDHFLGTAVFGPEKLTFGLPSANDLKVDPAAVKSAVATATQAATPPPTANAA
jgi:uncharacterized RDD family membrane protein YckC